MKKNILLLTILTILAAMPARANEPVAEAEAPVEFTAEADAEFQNVQIAVEGTQVHISNAEGLVLEIFNLAGTRISSFKIESNVAVVNLNLQHGCYILKVGKVVRKVSIR
jgi:hypothetical protein